jgi:site-specific DNA-methyltransferase (adenine-specific)
MSDILQDLEDKNMNYTLHQGDCLEKLKLIPDGAVDMVMCDLPYGTTACKWDSVIPFEPLWAAYRRVCKKNAAIVLTASQPFTSALVMSNLGDFKYAWVWVKNRPTGAQHAKNRPMAKHEDVLVFSFGRMGHAVQVGDMRMPYNPQGVSDAGVKTVTAKGFHSSITGPRPNQVGNVYMAQTGFPHTVLHFNKEESHVHPTQKPVALMEYLIRTYTTEGQTVLDNTMGSGTTGVACMNINRRFIGIERDDKYFEVAQGRVEAAHKNYVENLL